MLINHKLAPLILDPNGNIWIALCLVSLSSNNKPGNIVIKNKKERLMFDYDVALKKWNEQKIVRLNNQEKEILMLSCQGFTVERIAQELYLSTDTIKFHKKNLFKKLKARNISEAILSAINIGII
jgi:DNA-binding NarL/FixJ family response regulator